MEITKVEKLLPDMDVLTPLIPECEILLPLVPEFEKSGEYLRDGFVVG